MEQDYYFAFLRHGSYHQKAKVPSAWQPYSLDQAGFQQSEAAAKKLLNFAAQKNLAIAPTLYSSNLLRAYQTACELDRAMHSPSEIHCSQALNERSVGALANLTLEEIDLILHEDPRVEHPGFVWKADSHYRLPFDGAESLMDAGQRVADFIRSQAPQAGAKSLSIFVGHGASFRHAAHLLGILEFDQIRQLSMHYAEPIIFQWQSESRVFKRVFGDWKYRDLPPSATEQKTESHFID